VIFFINYKSLEKGVADNFDRVIAHAVLERLFFDLTRYQKKLLENQPQESAQVACLQNRMWCPALEYRLQ